MALIDRISQPIHESRRGCAAWLAALAPAAWGVVLLQGFASGKMLQVLHPLFHAFAGVAGAGFLAVALWQSVHGGRSAFASSNLRGLILLGILVVPVAWAARGAPAGFSPEAMRKRGAGQSGMLPDLGSYRASPMLADWENSDPSIPVEVSMVDVLLALEDPATAAALQNRRIHVVGQLLHLPESGHFKVTRMLMFCCAADAVPVGVWVRGEAPVASDGSWLRVTGQVSLEQDGPHRRPVLSLENAEVVSPPRVIFLQ